MEFPSEHAILQRLFVALPTLARNPSFPANYFGQRGCRHEELNAIGPDCPILGAVEIFSVL
jgi:hypothetical protein